MIIGPDPVRRRQIRMTTTGDLPPAEQFLHRHRDRGAV